MDFKTTLAGVQLPGCMWNASGPRCTTKEELDALGESNAAVILMKSCTLEPREGNPEPRYVNVEFGSINSMGLPNLGYEEYIRLLPGLKEHGKPVMASVSGLSMQDNITMVAAFNETNIDLLELNLSCPNIVGKSQVSYDFEQMDAILEAIMKITKKPLGVKLSPYFDFVHFEQAAEILNKHKVAFVTCINSVGNGLYIDVEKEQVVIKPKGGFGGIGGRYVKPTALANVHMFSKLLNKDIDIVGVGGIENAQDIFEFILAGATAVQVGTAFMKQGPEIFTRLEKELAEFLTAKGYSSLEDFRGKLKAIE